MNKFIVAAFAIAITACGSEYDPYNNPSPPPPVYTPPVETQVDEGLKEFYNDFVAECEARNHTTCMRIVNLRLLEYVKFVDEATLRKGEDAANRVGVCYSWTDQNKKLIKAQVQVLDNNGSGQPWSRAQLRGLVYHELGHCLLGLDHTCEMTDPNCKQDVTNPHMMFPSIYAPYVYIQYWQQMTDELFDTVGHWLSLVEEFVSDDTVQGPITMRVQE